MLTKKIIHIDVSMLETILQTVYVADFVLQEEEQSSYTMEVITRTIGGSEMGHYQIDRIRNGGRKAWRQVESIMKFIRAISPDGLQVTVIFKLFNEKRSLREIPSDN